MFRKDPTDPTSGFTLTTGTILSATVQEDKVISLTADFPGIQNEPVIGLYGDFRLDPPDREQLKQFLSRAAKTEIHC